MRHYEVTFIVDPVLSGDEVKSTAKSYQDILTSEGARIIHVDEMGLRPLAYSINKRSTGVYYTIEFTSETGTFIDKFELTLKRDERIMRFLTVKLDKYAVKYNEDKRSGKIGKRVPKEPVVKKPLEYIPYQAFNPEAVNSKRSAEPEVAPTEKPQEN
ncbi:MAG: 30S ribosomal protein S6 [Saprospiraceae bacterium]|nr:30S ribosomal protein S6 [Saprospiraceae bacterium]HMW37913.1 30S ribosomal protein S6 [Saprospiraceae bacterium]HMX87343.1 30S ribosomal protein S6 [Saprospiraceae bacterium]HMZ39170.1 30S ribosomal protein S6 [Saprospiraceae bacterium]HNA63831.1 30S ribosomal protein S6 [Saprospiraceae bacterium]